jgi:CheY-like chemotaxis protein
MSTPSDLSPERIREIAHELRSPLGGFDAMIEMLGATDLSPEQARIVAALSAASHHLRGVANAVLAPGAAGEATEVPLGRLISDIAIAAAARAETRGLRFTCAGPRAELQSVPVEPGPLRQVIENLLDNAVRVSERGTLTLSVERGEAGRLAISVTDEGPGIGEAEVARLIREGGSVEGRASGAGLGLRIAGRLVAARGGRLQGGPAPGGEGSQFIFDWPGEAATTSRAVQCLIVDDHSAARRVLATILDSAGYPCAEADRVDEALELIGELGPALVLTDLAMPDGGGRALIERIGALPAKDRPAIVVVSADAIAEDDPLRSSIAGAIEKPIAVRSVLEIVGALVPGAARAA